jgi:DNA-binding protein HU-beta
MKPKVTRQILYRDYQANLKALGYDFNPKTAIDCFNAVFETILENLLAGDRVQITRFGTFEIREVPEKGGYDIKTKQKIVIPRHKKIGFKPSQKLKLNVCKN